MRIIKVPGINGLGMTNGAQLGPNAITNDGEELVLDDDDINEQEKTIYNFAKNLKEKAIFIGGDHSISYPITKAFFEKFKDLRLIVLDAHPDLMPPMENPTHEEWLMATILSGLPKSNILLIGARNIDVKETGHGITMIPVKDINNSKEKIREFVKNHPVYLSIDIDFFDKSIAPATGYPEPNGAKKKDGMDLIKSIITSGIVGCDIVEINPLKKGSKKTIALAREILETLKNGF